MKRAIITISENGSVTVPSEVKMSISDIADLFGIYYQTAKRTIRTIKKLGIADGDYSLICSTESNKVYPEYYGLEMIIAVAFHVQSARAEIFRQWIIKKVLRHDITAMLVMPLQNAMLN